MPDWVTANAWSIASIVVGLVAIGLAIAIALVQRRTKRVAFEVLSRTQLVGAIGDIPELDVSFRGQRVTDVMVIELRVLNEGNVAVAPSDYERPIRISFGPEAAVLTADIERVHPRSLRIECHPDADALVLEPVMLNGGDWVGVKTLVSRAGTVTADARILGVREVGPRTERSSSLVRILATLGLLVMAWGLYFAGQGQNSALPLIPPLVVLAGAIWVLGDPGSLRGVSRRLMQGGATSAAPQAGPSETHAGTAAPLETEERISVAVTPPRQVATQEPWVPSSRDLDAALQKAIEAAAAIGPDAVLEFLWTDIFPAHELNFRGTSIVADRYFQVTVDDHGETTVYGVRRLSRVYPAGKHGNEAPWRTVAGWQDLVSLSWLRVVKPFTGSAQLRAQTTIESPRWSVSYESQGAIWESTCYELVEGMPLEFPC